LGSYAMGQPAESEFQFPVEKHNDHTSPWAMPDVLSGGTLPPILENPGPIFNNLPDITSHNFPSAEIKTSPQGSATDKPAGTRGSAPELFNNSTESKKILNGFSIGSETKSNISNGSDSTPAGSDGGSKLGGLGDLFKSIGDKLPQILAKVGEFLQSKLPPEYAQYVQQYMPMVEQFISKMVKDVNLSQGQNGAQHLNAELQESQSIPDLIPGNTLNVDQNLSFDAKSSQNGAEISNIKGLHLSGDNGGELRSARIDFGDGEPRIYASVQSENGDTNEVEIPLPDLSSILGF
jgi:hypothetical protein